MVPTHPFAWPLGQHKESAVGQAGKGLRPRIGTKALHRGGLHLLHIAEVAVAPLDRIGPFIREPDAPRPGIARNRLDIDQVLECIGIASDPAEPRLIPGALNAETEVTPPVAGGVKVSTRQSQQRRIAAEMLVCARQHPNAFDAQGAEFWRHARDLPDRQSRRMIGRLWAAAQPGARSKQCDQRKNQDLSAHDCALAPSQRLALSSSVRRRAADRAVHRAI